MLKKIALVQNSTQESDIIYPDLESSYQLIGKASLLLRYQTLSDYVMLPSSAKVSVS